VRGLITVLLSLACCAFGQNPTISNGGVVDAANFAPGQALAPGSLAAIFGSDLAGTLTLADSVPLARSLPT